MKICFIPIDNRPVCYNLAKDICTIDEEIELLIPPRNLLGDLTKQADIKNLMLWLKNSPEVDSIILSLDTIIYGGLIPSRRSTETFSELQDRVNTLKEVLIKKKAKVYAFSSIMRISNNNYNEEEKEYWKDWGKKIFEYSYRTHKGENANIDIPQEILEDYLATRERNFEINKLYLEWQKEGIFETLIFSKDDCAEFGLNVKEAQILESMGGMTKTGADEIPLALLSRSITKNVKIYPVFTEPEYKNCISNYEDISIEQSVLSQLELGGFKAADSYNDADLILIVNNFIEKQGELVMRWETKTYAHQFIPPSKPYAVADVRFANGADNDFMKQLLPQIELKNFYGYSGWNTSANTLGSLLAGIKVKFKASKYNEKAFKKLQVIRFLDDWAYQANIRGQIDSPCDIKVLMKPYENQLAQVFGYPINSQYSYPWGRKFELEIKI